MEADIGLIGLAVMGQNLALNINDHGYRIAVFNRTVSKVDRMLQGPAQGTEVIGTHSLTEFIRTLKRPRRILLMVQAGPAVDALIDQCLPLLEEGDILIDGGNSFYQDTERRCKALKQKGIRFVGAGISGGEEGARHGPSIMPGGDPEAWPHIKEILQSISAKVDNRPCCEWVGDGGAGHYVKMVHNGIEYGDMQLICEAYDLLHHVAGCDTDQLSNVFARWNEGELESYLIEITRDIFARKDDDGEALVDKVLDVAGQKGTGKWTGIDALHLGVPASLIAEAVFARCLSARKEERSAASKSLTGPTPAKIENAEAFIDKIQQALYAAKIISYTQGFLLMKEAAKEYSWRLNMGAIALMWRGGCIIRSRFLNDIEAAFSNNPNLSSLLMDTFFQKAVQNAQSSWRSVLQSAIANGISTPCLSAGLAFYDGYRRERLPTHLLQAQRDYFGAHTYERTDSPRGKFFHSEWK